MKKILIANKLAIEISVLTVLVLVVGILSASHFGIGGPVQAQGPSCPNSPGCDAVVRTLSATEPREFMTAIVGRNTSDTSCCSSAGVRGEAIGGIGVWGIATAATGTAVGVRGESRSTSTFAAGVEGFSSTDAAGVRGFSLTGTGISGSGQVGVSGTSFRPAGTGVSGLVYDGGGENVGVRGESQSSQGVGVLAVNTRGGLALATNGSAVVAGDVVVYGDFYVKGDKASLAEVPGGKKVALYAVESPENWFEDFGSGRLQKGSVVVPIKEDFSETVNTGTAYHIFLTPKGNCNGLYVAQQTATSFEVRELNGGTTNVPFDYRIVAKRRGHESQRLRQIK